jgi:hypothetical protein
MSHSHPMGHHFNIHALCNVRKHPCLFTLFWTSGSCKEFFKNVFLYKHWQSSPSHIVTPPDSAWLWFWQTCYWIMSEHFHINFSFSDPAVLEKNTFKSTDVMFSVLWLSSLPFEDEPTLYYNTYGLSLYQVWLKSKFPCLFWKRKF